MEFPAFSGRASIRLTVEGRADLHSSAYRADSLVYMFITFHQGQYPVHSMCPILYVAPSEYYDWLGQPISKCAQEDAGLLRRLARLTTLAAEAEA